MRGMSKEKAKKLSQQEKDRQRVIAKQKEEEGRIEMGT